jgi:hypothetical protein
MIPKLSDDPDFLLTEQMKNPIILSNQENKAFEGGTQHGCASPP